MALNWSMIIGIGPQPRATSTDEVPSTSDLVRMQDRAIAAVKEWYEQWRTYHNHKETLAIGGITFQLTTFGAALISDRWPPFAPWKTSVLITVAWLLILFYLKWQLHRRRWAAIRFAGADKVLAAWIKEPPEVDDLKPTDPGDTRPSWCQVIVDYFGASKYVHPPVEGSMAVYPRALVEHWWKADKPAYTNAIVQERFIVIVGWLLYLLLVLRTFFPEWFQSPVVLPPL